MWASHFVRNGNKLSTSSWLATEVQVCRNVGRPNTRLPNLVVYIFHVIKKLLCFCFVSALVSKGKPSHLCVIYRFIVYTLFCSIPMILRFISERGVAFSAEGFLYGYFCTLSHSSFFWCNVVMNVSMYYRVIRTGEDVCMFIFLWILTRC